MHRDTPLQPSELQRALKAMLGSRIFFVFVAMITLPARANLPDHNGTLQYRGTTRGYLQRDHYHLRPRRRRLAHDHPGNVNGRTRRANYRPHASAVIRRLNVILTAHPGGT